MDTRESLRRMRNLRNGVVEDYDKKPIKEDNKKKEMSMRDMLAITRHKNINEASNVEMLDVNKDGDDDVKLVDTAVEDRKTAFDQDEQETQFRNAIKDFNVNVQFEPIEVMDNSILWNGTIDNQLQWSFLVTPDENVNGAKFNYSRNFDDTTPENSELVKRIDKYYTDFYKYWRENELEK
jgi:hypothetical protein